MNDYRYDDVEPRYRIFCDGEVECESISLKDYLKNGNPDPTVLESRMYAATLAVGEEYGYADGSHEMSVLRLPDIII